MLQFKLGCYTRCEGRGRVIVHFCVVIMIFWKLTPSVPAQDPALAPAQVTEGCCLAS